jgi:hypothetical protein
MNVNNVECSWSGSRRVRLREMNITVFAACLICRDAFHLDSKIWTEDVIFQFPIGWFKQTRKVRKFAIIANKTQTTFGIKDVSVSSHLRARKIRPAYRVEMSVFRFETSFGVIYRTSQNADSASKVSNFPLCTSYILSYNLR